MSLIACGRRRRTSEESLIAKAQDEAYNERLHRQSELCGGGGKEECSAGLFSLAGLVVPSAEILRRGRQPDEINTPAPFS
jgi:hypothetical protein